MENRSIKKVFEGDLIVNNLIRDLSASLPNSRFVPNETVIIFDEIQECANARSSIKVLQNKEKHNVDKAIKLINGNLGFI